MGYNLNVRSVIIGCANQDVVTGGYSSRTSYVGGVIGDTGNNADAT